MKTVAVKLFAGRGYFVKVGAPLGGLGRALRSFGVSKPVLVVSDRRVAPRYGGKVAAALRRAGFRPRLGVMAPGEKAKTLDSIRRLYREALLARLDRRSAVIALGGGVVGDAAGFMAATYLRGLSLVQCPTTLLAMVDSSIGGKVGVDLPEGKNLVGAFWQPRLVWMDLSVLRTLPDREWRTGIAEIIKYGIMADTQILTILEATDLARLQRTPALLEDLVARSVAIKARVVSQDENDTRGIRELLNLGHTFGHAIEAVSGYGGYTHGEAIAVGMCAAARLSAKLGESPEPAARLAPRAAWLNARLNGFSWAYVRRFETLIKRWGLPTRAGQPLSRLRILAAMSRDKKVYAGRFRFVVPVRWGKAAIAENPPKAVLSRVLTEVGL